MKAAGFICAILLSLQSSADEWYAHAVRLGGSGKSVEAVVAYRRAVELDPRHVNAWNNLADLLRRSGDLTGALDALDHALAVDPAHPRAALNAALTHIELKHFKEALPFIEKARQGLGDLPAFDYLAARAHLSLGDYESARPHLVRFSQSNSPSPAGALELATMLLNRTEYASAVEMLLAIPAEKRSDEILLRLSQAWYGLDQLEKAREILVDMTERTPGDFAGHLWRGYVERGLGNLEAAEQELQQALKSNPESGEALVAMANLKLERNDAAESVALSDHALKLNSQDAGALLVRGLAMLRLERPADAVQSLTKISKDTGVYAQALYPLSRAYRQLGETEHADAAIQEFRRLEALDASRGSIPARRRPR